MQKDVCVLLVTHRQEPFCTDRVAGALLARGAKVIRFNTDEFPTSADLRVDLESNERPKLWFSQEKLDVDAVWYWRLWPPHFDERMSPEHRQVATRESLTTLRGMLDLLSHVPWIDPIDPNACAENKTRQLALARSVGLAIPPTLITANPESARTFFYAHAGQVVCKLQHSLDYSMTGGRGFPTRLLTENDLESLQSLRYCPMMFQKFVPKAKELRIAWVDGDAFVGALDGAACGVDWRYEAGDAPWEHHTLPAPIHEKLAALMKLLGLRQGALDLILTPEGDYVFLEVNPHGEWGMLERDLGLPIGKAMANALLRLASQTNDRSNTKHQ